MTASASSYNSKAGVLQPHAKLIIHVEVIKGAVEILRARITQQVNIIGKCKFLVKSQILNWSNKACFREELPLGSLGSKKLAASESSCTKRVVFQLQKCADACKTTSRVTVTLVHC
jgi:hypothetical protein